MATRIQRVDVPQKSIQINIEIGTEIVIDKKTSKMTEAINGTQ